MEKVFNTYLQKKYNFTPTATFDGFTTSLVGVLPNGSASSPLLSWGWKTTFGGAFGGLKNLVPVDASSGTGGITITSVDGVAQIPPNVSCAATPTSLWPPNGKAVAVTVSGTVTLGTQPIPPGNLRYDVGDEYRQVQPSGAIAFGVGGAYTFAVPLVAARNGSDEHSRTYTINVIARDQFGNVGTCSALVTVPHDQRN